MAFPGGLPFPAQDEAVEFCCVKGNWVPVARAARVSDPWSVHSAPISPCCAVPALHSPCTGDT